MSLHYMKSLRGRDLDEELGCFTSNQDLVGTITVLELLDVLTKREQKADAAKRRVPPEVTELPVNVFEAHLQVCQQCREHPFGLCAEGEAAIRIAGRAAAAIARGLGMRIK